jgi:hypothetical protein
MSGDAEVMTFVLAHHLPFGIVDAHERRETRGGVWRLEPGTRRAHDVRVWIGRDEIATDFLDAGVSWRRCSRCRPFSLIDATSAGVLCQAW